jgi:hypothetical protein
MQSRPEDSPFLPMRPGHRAAVLLGLWGYLAAVGLLSYFHGTATTVWVFAALTLNFALLSLPLVFYRPGFGWTHPVVLHVFLVFLFSHLVRTPLYVRGLEHHLALPDWDRDGLARLVAIQLLLGAVALVAYYLGFFSGVGSRVPRLRLREPRAIAWTSLAVVAATVAVFAYYLRTQGGLQSHMLSWAEVGRVDAVQGEGHWLKISRLGGLAALIWLAFDGRALRKPLFWTAAAVTLTVSFLGSGSRSSAVFLLVVGTLIWMIRRRRMFALRGLLVVALCLVLVASLGRLRRGLFRGEVDWRTLVSVSAVESLGSVVDELLYRYGTLDSAYPVLARVPGEIDLLWGESYLTILALPIPRALWPEKPGTVGKLAGEVFYGVKAGIPPGAVAESYWNFHVPGVVLLFFLFGICHRFLASLLAANGEQPAVVVIYALTVFWNQPSVTAVAEWIYMTASALVLLWLLGALRRTEKKQAGVLPDLDARRTA